LTSTLKTSPCVQCGYCCSKSVCQFGAWDADRGQCEFLTEDKKCAMYDRIKDFPEAQISPAFGAGCCSAMFNGVRAKKIAQIQRENGWDAYDRAREAGREHKEALIEGMAAANRESTDA